MRHAFLPAAAALGLLAACQPTPLSQADKDAIRTLETSTIVAAVEAGNVDSVMAFYTSDATVQQHGVPPAVGTAAIRQQISDMFGPMKVRLTSQVTGIAGQGDVAYATGTYQITFIMKDSTKTPPPCEGGKWLNVLIRQPDRSWKIAVDAGNPNAQPVAAAPVRAARRR